MHNLAVNITSRTHLVPWKRLDVANFRLEFLQLLLCLGVFLGHLLVLRLPLVSFDFKSLNLTFEVASLDVSLPQPEFQESALSQQTTGWQEAAVKDTRKLTYLSLVSRRFLSASSASSSSSCSLRCRVSL